MQDKAPGAPHGIRCSDRDQALICQYCAESLEMDSASYWCPDRKLRLVEMFEIEHGGCRQYAGEPLKAKAHRRFVRSMRRQMKSIGR